LNFNESLVWLRKLFEERFGILDEITVKFFENYEKEFDYKRRTSYDQKEKKNNK